MSLPAFEAPASPFPLMKAFKPAHLLGIPFEVRLVIYGYVLQSMQNEGRNWQRNPCSRYLGLLLACKQLHGEASKHCFYDRVTRHQMSKLQGLPSNRTAFTNFRSLNIEIDFDLNERVLQSLSEVLHRFQLSLQELGLFFLGQDALGNKARVYGCGNKTVWEIGNDSKPLTEDGQDIEKKLIVLRQLIALRNLRILRVENANMPLMPAMFLINKKVLQAFSARCDSRSIVHGYGKWKDKKHILRGLLAQIDEKNLPPVKVLEVDANAVVPAADIVAMLGPTLQHLSWRVPNAGHQGTAQLHHPRFYQLTRDLMQTLQWRAPALHTLRLCIKMRNRPPSAERTRLDTAYIFASFSQALPMFTELRRLEIHYSDCDEFNFLHNRLVENLPHSLERLYISDTSIAAHQLCTQVRTRYFMDIVQLMKPQETPPTTPIVSREIMAQEKDTKPVLSYALTVASVSSLAEAKTIVINDFGQTWYVSTADVSSNETPAQGCRVVLRGPSGVSGEDYLHYGGLWVGEARYRDDRIPLDGGKLGFVTFEFDAIDIDAEIESGRIQVHDTDFESERTQIFRMNGRLLDREHNMHLADNVDEESSGIRHPTSTSKHKSGAVRSESDTYSIHSGIDIALYNTSELTSKPEGREMHLREINACEALQRDWYDWYFGDENDAEQVFLKEPAAEIEGMRVKPTILETQPEYSARCRWMCPDADIDPVGSFPTPPIPKDWRD